MLNVDKQNNSLKQVDFLSLCIDILNNFLQLFLLSTI